MAVRTYRPPSSVARAAARGLKWREVYKRGGLRADVARARHLAQGGRVSFTTVKRMVEYFKAHQQDAAAPGWFYGEREYPCAERVAWELWGGDAALKWARTIYIPFEETIPIASFTFGFRSLTGGGKWKS